jgi:hypothetical protein
MDGEPVDAGTTGRPLRQIEQNVLALRNQLELALLGQVLIARDIDIDPSVQPGQPVYWNAENARAEAALASLEFDTTLQTLVGTAKSQVLGLLMQKTGSTSGDIVLFGWLSLDITNALDSQPLQTGRYYLSAQNPGILLSSRASLSVPVLYADGTGNVLVFPQWREWAEDHEHFRISLNCIPAGDHLPPDVGQRHTITNPDTALAGWLPASHAIFGGHAPPGAAFGYNINAHPALKRLFPPLPPSACTLIWDKGIDATGGTEVPITLAVVDRYGIWWLSNCYGDVPWPADFTFTDGDTLD